MRNKHIPFPSEFCRHGQLSVEILGMDFACPAAAYACVRCVDGGRGFDVEESLGLALHTAPYGETWGGTAQEGLECACGGHCDDFFLKRNVVLCLSLRLVLESGGW